MTCSVTDGGRLCVFVCSGQISGIRYESQEHCNLAFDAGFTKNVSRMGLHRAGFYTQGARDAPVPETLTNQLRDLALPRRQTISILHV